MITDEDVEVAADDKVDAAAVVDDILVAVDSAPDSLDNASLWSVSGDLLRLMSRRC